MCLWCTQGLFGPHQDSLLMLTHPYGSSAWKRHGFASEDPVHALSS